MRGTLTLAGSLSLLFACGPTKVTLYDTSSIPDGDLDDTGDTADTADSGETGDTGTTASSLEADPTLLDFELLFVGAAARQVVYLQNVGLDDATIEAVVEQANGADFSVEVADAEVVPGETVELAVTFAPVTWGFVSADLVITDVVGGAEVRVALAGEAQVDEDGDGVGSIGSGGADCDDYDARAYPGAAEVWYDGVDEDCLGGDDYDRDADGADYTVDCDETDPSVYPGAAEVWYDGIDQDCLADDDFDQDGDGQQTGIDCDDTDATVYDGAVETWYDGVDQDCDGNDSDQDGDGADHTVDCDDTDASAYPGAPETWYDGVDSDCSGGSDHDQDADGVDYPTDCNDTDATVVGPTTETWDGTDEDCDGAIDDLAIGDVASGVLYGPTSSLALGGRNGLSLGGDVTGDGADDLVVASASSGYGYAWVVSGSTAATAAGSVESYDTAAITGQSGYAMGYLVGPMQDLTGDGTDDVLVAGSSSSTYYGRGWLLTGGSSLSGSISVSSTYRARFDGDSYTDQLRWVVAGDFDGDGSAEVASGSPTDNYTSGWSADYYAGNVAVFDGSFSGSYDLQDAEDEIHGSNDYDYLGYTLAAGDVDGDGYDDVIAGAPGLDAGASGAGGVYLFAGNASLAWSDRADSAMDVRIVSSTASAGLGTDALATPGDVDGDGTTDLLLGSQTSGCAWLWWDGSSLGGSTTVSSADLVFSGTAGAFPTALAYASDLDGDGADDVVLGKSGDDTAYTDGGAAFVYRPPTGTTGTWTTADASAALYGAATSDALGAGLASGGDADGDGVEDLLVGASGSDGGASNGGAVYVVLGR